MEDTKPWQGRVIVSTHACRRYLERFLGWSEDETADLPGQLIYELRQALEYEARRARPATKQERRAVFRSKLGYRKTLSNDYYDGVPIMSDAHSMALVVTYDSIRGLATMVVKTVLNMADRSSDAA